MMQAQIWSVYQRICIPFIEIGIHVPCMFLAKQPS